MAVQTYQGPPTEGLDIDGLRALVKMGAMDQTVVLEQIVDPTNDAPFSVTRPFFRKGKRRRVMDARLWWTLLTVGLSLCFVAVVWFSTMGVYSWLRAHGA